MRRILLSLLALALLSSVLIASPASAAAPEAPTVTLGAVTSSTIEVSWSPSASGDPVDVYDVTISPNTGATGTLLNTTATTTTFSGLDPNVTHTVSVVAKNIDGSSPAGTVIAKTLVAPPGTPVITVGAVTSTSIAVSWTATSGGATNQYDVSISPDAGAVGTKTDTFDTSTTFTGLRPGIAYTITVVADNLQGPTSSASVNQTTAVAAPGTPSIQLDSSTLTSLTVSWTATPNGEAPTYQAFLTPAAGGGTIAAGSTATTTTFTGLTPGTSYTATVRATNSAGTSENTAVFATQAVQAPGAPVITVGTVTASSIAVSWTSTNGGGTNSYNVSISPNAGASGTKTNTTDTSTTFTGLAPNVLHTITVTATNAGGAASNTATATTAIAAPSAPTNVAAALAGSFNQAVLVSWNPPTNIGGSEVIEYVVRLSNGATQTVGGAGSGPFEFEFTTVPPGSTVTATVAAVNAAGQGAASAPTSAVTTADVPDKVAGLAGEWAGSTALNSMNLTWSPADGNGAPVTSYLITLSPAITDDPIDAGTATSFTVSGLDPGTTYEVKVTAVNAVGSGPASNPVNVLIPTTPGAVNDLEVSQSRPFAADVTVTWAPPTNSGGVPVVSYEVTVGGQTRTVDAATRSVTFTGLAVGEYTASVRPVTRAGDGPLSTSAGFEVRGFGPFDNEDQFLRQLHQDMFSTPIDGPTLAFWKGQLADDASNVESVIAQFMNDRRYDLRRPIARLYFAYFDRRPDKGGFDYWNQILVSQTADLQFTSDLFATSPEFQLTYGVLDNASFVVLVYNNVLVRRPDQGGFSYWYGLLNSGAITRGEMMTFFSDSAEFVRKSEPAVEAVLAYDALLQRQASLQEFKDARTDLAAGDSAFATLLRQLFESTEYAQRFGG